jgi:phospholipid/cholesterol/gamma-HCH transport system substrate-binding protein
MGERNGQIVTYVAGAVVLVVLGLLLFGGGSSYKVYAQFTDAGQLVNGDLVTLDGHQVGLVGGITLSNNGLANVELDITDSSITPLREGTLAQIGQLSLTGIANRFVGLTLGSGENEISDGGTIPPSQTRGIVDLDVLLNALTPQVRSSLQKIIKTGAYIFSAPTPAEANQAFHYVNPALSQLTQLGAEVVADRFALDRLISSTANVSAALAADSGNLGNAVTSTATTLNEIASQNSALGDALGRAPAVLTQSSAVFNDVDYALGVLDPVLKDLQPVAPPLATLLRKLLPVARNAVPTIRGVQALVPSAVKALKAFPPVEKVATPAVGSLTKALGAATPILAGLRPYAPDVITGFFNALGGSDGQGYDANGHFVRLQVELSGSTASLAGAASLIGGVVPSGLGPTGNPPALGRCPGGGAPPSPDGTSPWTSPDVLPATGVICNPNDDQK